MPSKYSIIQYVPDVITEERINIGVVAFDENNVRVKFLSRWTRVKQFANQDIRFLQTFAKDFASTASPNLLSGLDLYPKLDVEQLTKIIGKWGNTIQFSEPKASLKKSDELLKDIVSRFLPEPATKQRTYRDRRAAVRIATDGIFHALNERLGKEQADNLFKAHYPSIKGKFKNHTFDAVVANGAPYLGAMGFSFELPEALELETHIDAVAFSIKDVRDEFKRLPIGVVTLPPKGNPKAGERILTLHDETIKMYKKLGAEILEDGGQVEGWADDIVRRIRL